MLERSTHLCDDLGGGSLTALPIAETEAQNVSAYIPTNLISITDGQIYLSPTLFRKGVLPAVDVGRSVSRVGGKTQLPAYRAVAGRLRLSYSQFEELERFARFSSQLDDETRKALNRGQRVRATLMQTLHDTIPVAEQLAELIAVTGGVFDALDVLHIGDAANAVRAAVVGELPELSDRILDGQLLSAELLSQVRELAGEVIKPWLEDSPDGNA